MGDQVLLTSTLSENASLKDTIRWLKAFADTVQSASGRNLIQDVNASGAVLSSIKNAKANQFPYFTGPTSVALATLQTVVNVLDFGADPTGVADSTTAIQNAINSLPAAGGIVFFPAGTYKISSTITLGNGTSSTQSTKQGIYLVGVGNQGQGTGASTVLSWAGSSGGLCVWMSGPIQSGGVSNLVIAGNNIAGFGLKLLATCGSKVDSVTISGCTQDSFLMQAYTTGGTGHPDTQFNDINNLTVYLPAVANARGIFVDGDNTDALSNSSFNTFRNCGVFPATSAVGMNCYYLKGCDSNAFISCSAFGGGSGTSGVVFDYTATGISGAWPANNVFVDFDSGINLSGGSSWLNVGSPGAGARPNRFYGIADTNSEVYPKLANTSYNAEIINPGAALTGQTASIGATNINPIALYVTGMYRISWALQVTTAGTAGTVALNLSWTDETGAHTATLNTVNLNTLGSSSNEFPIRALSGSNISFSTTVAGAAGGPQYAVFFKLEKLD